MLMENRILCDIEGVTKNRLSEDSFLSNKSNRIYLAQS